MWISALNHAEPTTASACISHQHESSCPTAPTFSNVGTMCLFTNRMQVVFPKYSLDLLVVLTCRITHTSPFRLLCTRHLLDLQETRPAAPVNPPTNSMARALSGVVSPATGAGTTHRQIL